MKTSDDCCDDQLEVVKIDNDQTAGLVLHSPTPEFNLICELFVEDGNNTVLNPSFEFTSDHNLPPPKVPIYKKVCSFVFYESVI